MARAGPRVAIAGGSLGGLTAAVLLADRGCDVHVFERSGSELTGRGVGIVVHPVTVRYPVENGGVLLDEISTAAERWVYLDASGGVLHAEPCAYRFTAWNTLYRTLRRCLPEARYHFGRPLLGFDAMATGVRAEFGGGDRIEVDLLVCADGSHSTGRSILLPGVAPQYSGYVGWRGTVAEAEISSESLAVLAGTISYHIPKRSHILVYPIPSVDGSVAAGDRLINFVWYRNVARTELEPLMTDRRGEIRELSVPPGLVATPYVDELRHAARSLPPPIAEVVLRTEEPFVQQVVDVQVPRMAFGRTCLLGDAAFTARPHAAAGTAKAAADAWALAAAMEQAGGDVEAALARWEPAQVALGAGLVERSRQMGERYQVSGDAEPSDPFLRFGLRRPRDSEVVPDQARSIT